MFAKGNKVAILDEAISGIIIKVNQNTITVLTQDGFELNYQANELINLENNEIDLAKTHITASIKDKQSFKKHTKNLKQTKKNETILEIDLHIEKLVSSSKRMGNYDILNIQLETAQKQLDFALKNRIQKIVFIHGVGEGILKAELDFLLNRYSNISFQEANFQKYGFGATEVHINQKNFL